MILLSLHKRGPMTLEGLEDTIFVLQSHFELPAQEFVRTIIERFKSPFARVGLPADRIPPLEIRQELPDIHGECASLVEKGMVRDQGGLLFITEEGEVVARKFAEDLERAARFVNRNLFNPQAAARNTVAVDLLLAVVKLAAGLLSGSVGLIADGADAAIDTASASVVWAGIRYRKELLGTVVIVVMMLFTGLMVGLESVTRVAAVLTSTVEAISRPYLVIIVEGFALLAAVVLTFYQSFVGKRSGSLALISQSIDSKNHIYVAGVVMLAAALSLLGVHFVDPFVGVYIALKIMIDGSSLAREAISCIRGGEADLSKYSMPLEGDWQLSKQGTFRNWVLHVLRERGRSTREEIVSVLQDTFNPPYAPILTEFDYRLGKGTDFEAEFKELVGPLIELGWVFADGEIYELSASGVEQVDRVFHFARYRQGVRG
jgi:hypothetical protein